MQVNSATSADRAASNAADATAGTVAAKKTSLDSTDFLKLLAVQFQQQDPMKPMEDTAFIAQMAQFSALEQNTALVTQVTSLAASQDVATANSYLGRQVTLDDGNGGLVTGEVSGVETSDGTPRLVIGDYTYPLSAVLLVEPLSPTSPTTDLPPAA